MQHVYEKVLKELYPYSWQRKWAQKRGTFTPTSEKVSRNGYQGDVDEQILRPSMVLKYFMVLMVVIACVAIVSLYFLESKIRTNPLSLLLIIPLITMAWVIWYVFTHPSLNYILRISRTGMQLNDTLYTWDRIEDTFTLFVPQGKSATYYLIVILKDGQFFKVNISSLGLLWGGVTKVSTAVEHFKRMAVQRL